LNTLLQKEWNRPKASLGGEKNVPGESRKEPAIEEAQTLEPKNRDGVLAIG